MDSREYRNFTILFGRLIRKNLFLVSDAHVMRSFVQYIGDRTSRRGAELLKLDQGWHVAEFLCRHYFELKTRGKSTRNPREIAAIEIFLMTQQASDTELARLAKTTEKQLARMTTLTLARKLLDCQTSRRTSRHK